MQSKILIIADMEGCTGIADMGQYDVCREKMTEEVGRVIQSIENLEDADITVADCHNQGKNIVEHFSDKGYACCEHIWSIRDVEKYDCAMLVGFHPRNGETGFCPHTIRPDVDELFLGEKSIGEVELVINWLAGHGVPVVFVSGDEAVRKELDGHRCEFYVTNEAGKEDLDQKVLLEQMGPYIKRALDLVGVVKTRYDVSTVKVKLMGENYYKWLPQELFSIENGKVVFLDTESFILRLFSFCMFLNIADQYQRLRMSHLVKRIKKSSDCVEKDLRWEKLLNQKDWRALSDEEIMYLYRLSEANSV